MASSFSALRVPDDPADIAESTELVERIRDLRQEMGLSQGKFAERFGLSWETFKNWETRRRQPDIATMLLLELILLDPDGMCRMVNRVKANRARRGWSLIKTG